MANLMAEFINFFRALEKYDVDYILIGGIAVVLHGFERFTRDIDIVINLRPGNLEKLKTALFSVFEDKAIDEIKESDFYDYPVIRYGTPNDFDIDIMYKIGTEFDFGNLHFETIHFNGVAIKIATLETLLALKENTLRDKDKIDAVFLKELIKSKQKES